MKRGINHGMMPSLLVAITLLTALHAQATVVNFPDKKLEAAINVRRVIVFILCAFRIRNELIRLEIRSGGSAVLMTA